MKQLGARLANWMPVVPGGACPRASDSGLWSHVRVSHAGASGGRGVCIAVRNTAPQCIPEGLLVLTDAPCCLVTWPVMGRVFWEGEEGGLKCLYGSFKLLFKIPFPRPLPILLRNGKDMLVFHIRACHTGKRAVLGSSCPSVDLEPLRWMAGMAVQ